AETYGHSRHRVALLIKNAATYASIRRGRHRQRVKGFDVSKEDALTVREHVIPIVGLPQGISTIQDRDRDSPARINVQNVAGRDHRGVPVGPHNYSAGRTRLNVERLVTVKAVHR